MTMELRREAERREQERLALRRREQDFARDVKSVAGAPAGKRVLRRLLADADLFNPAWTGGEEGAYRAGKKARAVELWRILRTALPPEECVDLLRPPAGVPGPDPDDGGEEEKEASVY